jgi:hypothetical protein
VSTFAIVRISFYARKSPLVASDINASIDSGEKVDMREGSNVSSSGVGAPWI